MWCTTTEPTSIWPATTLHCEPLTSTAHTRYCGCAFSDHVKPTHVVSSYSVHASHDHSADDVITETEPLPDFALLQNGYAKTKWVCETMVAEADAEACP